VTSIRKWLLGLAGIRNWLRVVTGIRKWLLGLAGITNWLRVVTGIRSWLRVVTGFRSWLPGCGCYYTLINRLWLVLGTGYRIVTGIRNWLPGLAGTVNWLRFVTGIIYWLPGCDCYYTLVNWLWLVLDNGYQIVSNIRNRLPSCNAIIHLLTGRYWYHTG